MVPTSPLDYNSRKKVDFVNNTPPRDSSIHDIDASDTSDQQFCGESACMLGGVDSILSLFTLGLYKRKTNNKDFFDDKSFQSTWSIDDIKLLSDFESMLERVGFVCTLYLPTKSSSVPKEQEAIVRKKRSTNRLECEVLVDGKPKLFRFSISEIDDVGIGKGKSNVIPEDVKDDVCLYFLIRNKGELSLVLKSGKMRDSFLQGMALLLRKKTLS